MPIWTDLAPFLLLGLVGAGHCAGMCGGFALLVGEGPGAGRLLAHQLAYVAGKALTYAVLGALLAAGSGFVLGELGHAELGAIRVVLAWLVGALLVGAGLASLGVRLPGAGLSHAARSPLVRAGARLFAAVRSLPGFTASFGTGLVTGLLPCGLSWGALLLATQSTVPGAFGGMLLFGLATGPALVATALFGRALARRAGAHGRFLLGSALVLLGLVTLVRGGTWPAGAAEANACCVEAPS